jgi:hypothetical protein
MVIHLLMVEIMFRYYGNTIRTKFTCIFLGVFGAILHLNTPFVAVAITNFEKIIDLRI